MRVDLRHVFTEGMNQLTTWRNRYTKDEYPEKVLLNMFYKKYTLEFMWKEINESFNQGAVWDDFNVGFRNLKEVYQQTAIRDTQPVLLDLISNHPDRTVGNVSYNSYDYRIRGFKDGKPDDLEEIEFAYLFNLLADECVLLWAAFGTTGLTKRESLEKMSGVVLENNQIDSYPQIEGLLGRLCVAKYMHETYNPLPPI